MRTILKEHARKWSFQLELCPTTKRKHLQIRLKLKVAAREKTVVEYFLKSVIIDDKETEWGRVSLTTAGPWCGVSTRKVKNLKYDA